MFGFSLQTLQSIFFFTTVIAALAGGISVVCALTSAMVGYKISDIVQTEAERRISEAEKKIAPRFINRTKFISTIRGEPKTSVEIMYSRDDPECYDLAQQLRSVLLEADWPVIGIFPITNKLFLEYKDIPLALMYEDAPIAMSFGGQPAGVTVVTHIASKEESEAISGFVFTDNKNWKKTPWTVLQYALLQSLGKISGAAGGISSPPEGTLRVIIAPKS
jgi:hypothetical protein